MALEPLFQLAEPLEFLLPDLGGRDLGPQLDNVGNILHGQLGIALQKQGVQLRLTLEDLAFQRGDLLVIRLRAFLRPLLLQHGPFLFKVIDLPLKLHPPGDVRVLQVQVGAGLIDQVNGLVRQEAVGDIPLAQQHRLTQDTVGDLDAVIRLVVGGQTLEDLDGILDGRLVHRHRLEPALQGAVLLDGFAVFIKGGGADDLNFPPGKGGLQDVGSVHAALGISCTHDVVDLVDHQDDVTQLFDLVDEALHPLLKLASELGAGHQRRQVEEVDLLVSQLKGHIPCHDPLGQALGNGGLAHAGFTDEAGVVLLAAVQDLDDPLDLLRPADHRVQLALLGLAVQGDAVALQELPLAVGLPLFFLPAAAVLRRRLLLGSRLAAVVEQAVQKREGSGLAGFLVILSAGQILHILDGVHGLHHFIIQIIQVFIRDAHALHHVVHLRQSQALGALQAQTLVNGLVPLHPGDEHRGNILFTSGTKCWLHSYLRTPRSARRSIGKL